MAKKEQQLSFGYIKAEGINNACEDLVRASLPRLGLKLIREQDIWMSYEKLRIHQPILFDLHNDLDDIWKIQGAARLISSTVRCLVVMGDNAIAELYNLKLNIRKKFALPCEFDRSAQISYPNYMHAADNKEQVEHDIRVLMPDMLKLCIDINGSHTMSSTVW